eukprot:526398-Rhodomonas_salina.1
MLKVPGIPAGLALMKQTQRTWVKWDMAVEGGKTNEEIKGNLSSRNWKYTRRLCPSLVVGVEMDRDGQRVNYLSFSPFFSLYSSAHLALPLSPLFSPSFPQLWLALACPLTLFTCHVTIAVTPSVWPFKLSNEEASNLAFTTSSPLSTSAPSSPCSPVSAAGMKCECRSGGEEAAGERLGGTESGRRAAASEGERRPREVYAWGVQREEEEGRRQEGEKRGAGRV